ncbi:MAG: hypothetical protein IH798_06880 [Gemmatimonadetes bacterium]|nr:hypothetical protein [Gemmatimonadota bacterium]
MISRSSKDPTRGIRRFLADLRESADRRAWTQRRSGDRRVATVPIEDDRRVAERRSGVDRRVVITDRRRRVAETYSLENAELICQMVMHDDMEAACPKCDGNLMLGPVITRESKKVREVHCTDCRRCLVITDLPAEIQDTG